MSLVIAKKFVLVKEFEGLPKLSDFKLVEESLNVNLAQGEILTKAEWLSVDPYMRLKCVDPVSVGQTLKGCQVARVLKSRCLEFPEGSQIVGNFGWRDLTVFNPDPKAPRIYKTYTKIPQLKGLPDAYALGCIGMPGNAAYYGLIDLCQPKQNEVLVVNGAGGAVGSLVGQIGKIKGCKVLGFAGTKEKLDWMKKDLGFDHVFNYKEVNLNDTFKKFAPGGIDICFDNVGGEFIESAVRNMAQSGRYCKCGAIAEYNLVTKSDNLATDPKAIPEFLARGLQLRLVNVDSLYKTWFERPYKIRDWILEGKIKVRQTVVEPFENMPQAFIDLFNGKNVGKMVIKAS